MGNAAPHDAPRSRSFSCFKFCGESGEREWCFLDDLDELSPLEVSRIFSPMIQVIGLLIA